MSLLRSSNCLISERESLEIISRARTLFRSASYTWRSWINVLIAICCPRNPSSNSFNLSWFQSSLALDLKANVLEPDCPFVIRCVSSLRQENRTAHPTSAVSNAVARSCRACNMPSRSLLLRSSDWICERDALMVEVSEQMEMMVIGASL